MHIEDFHGAAYMMGWRAAADYRRSVEKDFDDFPNPHEKESQDWQLWNLGWNHEMQRAQVLAPGGDRWQLTGP